MALILCVIVVALVFEYVNGFHDAANSIATVVATKVLSPRQAVLLAAVTNLAGALSGAAVASTIGKGLVDIKYVSSATILCGLFGAIVWNLITWWKGLPSSSSHALIGGLVGSTVAAAGGNWGVVKFFVVAMATADNVITLLGRQCGETVEIVLPLLDRGKAGAAVGQRRFHGGIVVRVLCAVFVVGQVKTGLVAEAFSRLHQGKRRGQGFFDGPAAQQQLTAIHPMQPYPQRLLGGRVVRARGAY